MDEQIPDSYLKYLENQPTPTLNENVPTEHRVDSVSSLLRFFAIIILFVSGIVLLFGWSSARNNPFSIVGKNIPLEIFPGARDSNIVLLDALNQGIKMNGLKGDYSVRFNAENKNDSKEKIYVNSNGEYDAIEDIYSNTLFNARLGGEFNFWNGKRIFNFANRDLSYSQKFVDGINYINIDLPSNLKDFYIDNLEVDNDEMFGKDIEVGKSNSIFNSLIFDDILTWQLGLNYSNLKSLFKLPSFSSSNDQFRNSIVNYMGTDFVKRIGREADWIGRDSIKYEVDLNKLNSSSIKGDFVKSIINIIDKNPQIIKDQLCKEPEFPEVENKCHVEITRFFTTESSFEITRLESFLKNLEISDVYFWVEPVKGNINSFSLKLDLPKDIISNEKDNVIGNYTITEFSIKFKGSIYSNSEFVQVDKSNYGYFDLRRLFGE